MHDLTNKNIIDHGNYKAVYYPDHPNAWKGCGLVYLHRLIVENDLGRLLKRDEIVHHIDGDEHNNKISNLEVLTVADHNKLHKAVLKRIKCRACKEYFLPYRSSMKSCSISCGAKRPMKISKKVLASLIKKEPITKIAEKYGVSASAVIKWCKKLNIERPGRGYWSKMNRNVL